MNETLLTIAGSAGAVAAMVFAAWALGFRDHARIINADHLARLAAGAEPGAVIAESALDAKGRAALALLRDGRVFAAKAMGANMAVRTLPAAGVRIRLKGARVQAQFADAGFPGLTLDCAPKAPAWLSGLAARQR